jgi:glucose/arabinose dehydrogenase
VRRAFVAVVVAGAAVALALAVVLLDSGGDAKEPTKTGFAGGPLGAERRPELQRLRRYRLKPVKGAFTPRAGAEGLTLTRIGHFKGPTHIAFPPGDRGLFVVTQREGAIRAVRDGRIDPEPFLDLSARVGTYGYEQGLLSLAFAPDYEQSGRFYVMYTDKRDKPVVEEYRRSTSSPDRADPASRRQLLKIDHPTGPPPGTKVSEDPRVHNGGQLQFGPDGMLYVSTGDGGPQGDPADRAQNREVLMGKILRLDPRAGPGAKPEVWAYGLRNPYRFSFDRSTGDMYIGDVGGGLAEEIDLIPAGKRGLNFGWRCFEGTVKFKPCRGNGAGHVPPLLQRPGSAVVKRPVSIIGGYVIRDARLPAFRGKYIYSEFYSGELSVLEVKDGRVQSDRRLKLAVSPLAAFGEDTRGRIYTVSLFSGLVHRLDPA